MEKDYNLREHNSFPPSRKGSSCVYMDDKLGRIQTSTELKKNDISDVFGYVALLMIQNNWFEFDDLLD